MSSNNSSIIKYTILFFLLMITQTCIYACTAGSSKLSLSNLLLYLFSINVIMNTLSVAQNVTCTGIECHLDCIENRSCYGMIINCPSGYNCIINCSGKNACSMTKINGNNYHRLSIFGTGYSMQYATVTCPTRGDCSVVCFGDKGCYGSTFNATLSNKLNITVENGKYTLADAAMYCPYSLKTGFTNQCYLTVKQYANKAMNNLAIYAVEGGADIDLKCDQTRDEYYTHHPDPCDYNRDTKLISYSNYFCWDLGNEPTMYCSEDYSNFCVWGQQNMWYSGPAWSEYCQDMDFSISMYYEYYEFFQKCENEHSICNSYPIITQPPSFPPTHYPSNDPTMVPTESPTPAPSHSPMTYDMPFSSPKTIYIRTFGCDSGTCESQFANYTSFCQQHDFREYFMDSFSQCCDPLVTLLPTTTMSTTNNTSSSTYTPTNSPTPYPTYFTKKTEENCEVDYSDYCYSPHVETNCYKCSCLYNVSVLPSLTEYTHFAVSIKGNTTIEHAGNPTEWLYKVMFTINNIPCFQPNISFNFKRLNNDHADEIIQISDITCGGDGKPNNCNEYDTCFQQRYLGLDSISVNQNIVINVKQPRQIFDSICDTMDPYGTIDAFLTLHCTPHNGTTSTPSSVSPTNNPTVSPTFGPTCQSIEYGWNCFNGYNETPNCRDYGYDGNGVIDIGVGSWIFAKFLNINNQQIVFQGAGSVSTIFSHQLLNNENNLPILKCGWEQCYIKFKALTYLAHDDVLSIEKGGNLLFDDVQFENTDNLQIVLTGYGSSTRLTNTKFLNNENIRINLGG
eukprot:383413_1